MNKEDVPEWVTNLRSDVERAAYVKGFTATANHLDYVDAYGTAGVSDPVIPAWLAGSAEAQIRWEQGCDDARERHAAPDEDEGASWERQEPDQREAAAEERVINAMLDTPGM